MDPLIESFRKETFFLELTEPIRKSLSASIDTKSASLREVATKAENFYLQSEGRTQSKRFPQSRPDEGRGTRDSKASFPRKSKRRHQKSHWRKPKGGHRPPRRADSARPTGRPLSEVTYYKCYRKGYYSNDYRSNPKVQSTSAEARESTLSSKN
ncbi:hypothetical protein SPI_03415 [Niveomyces insectorum RCEF 264]|uniref:Uncharacterized protein n=1 Tax=Niveomyces insectorum RCEF 264 TaxID=1081102 RepID=A0A162J3G6_9HYPO|nr:hypothetical protein SPI_03415 [Niveomyces insectorum RCEF 264]